MLSDKLTAELDRIERLANAVGAGDWQQGRFLHLKQYEHMSAEWKADASLQERQRVFRDFTAEDRGESRKPVAITFHVDDAAFIADARTSNPRMVRLIRAMARVISTKNKADAARVREEERFDGEYDQILAERDAAESALAELQRKEWE